MENEIGGACGTHMRGEKSVEAFGGKARRKETLGRSRHRWEDGIRIDWLGGGVDSVASG
jgi:hypothetical protein